MRTKAALGKQPERFENHAREATEQFVQVPEHWEIYNATRPIYGTVTWVNTQMGAWFWAAVDPEDPDAELWRTRNQELDAARVTWWEIENVRRLTQEYYDNLMPGRVKVEDHSDGMVWDSFRNHVVPTLT